MNMKSFSFVLLCTSILFPFSSYSQIVYEIDGSSTSTAPYDKRYIADEDGNPIDRYQPSRQPVRQARENPDSFNESEGAPLPERIKASGEKMIIVDPHEHAWGAYNAAGQLIRWGLATAGANWCSDIDRPCRTKSGSFRIYSLGDETCISTKFPVPDGGAPMPYCMYFNGGQALHGSNEVVYGNVSHGCVRLHVSDARWLRYQFVESPNASNRYRGTMVIVRPY